MTFRQRRTHHGGGLTSALRGNLTMVMIWLLLPLALGSGAVQSETNAETPHMYLTPSNQSSESTHVNHPRPCTADELLPRSEDGFEGSAVEWGAHDMVEPRYGCDCPFYKAGYFCPKLGVGGSFKWVPRIVAEGVCQQKPFDQIETAPLPPDFRVLVYGNSHLRQVVESIMCMFQQSVEKRRVTMDRKTIMVPRDIHCRCCLGAGHEELLKEHHCVPPDVDCMCADDQGEFFFENGAMVHYVFAHTQEDKHIESSLHYHTATSMSYYDVVVANAGNPPYMNQSSLLQSAVKMQNEGVQLLWLSEYDGAGDIGDWNTSEKTRLADSGTMFLPVHYMVRGVEQWTKGFVDGGVMDGDPHYCLPGPPDQIGLLLLRILWALHDGWGGTRHVDGK